MKSLKYLFSLILLTMSIQGYCQQMYDRSGSYEGMVDSGCFYNRSKSYIGYERDGMFYDRLGSYIGYTKDEKFYDRPSSYTSGNNVYNSSGSLIGRVNRVPDLIAVLVYFYGYFPLR